jgi:uncharacterized protein DUF6152
VKAKALSLVFIGVITLAGPRVATAHHAFSPVYDGKRTISVQGVVTEFRLVNPHALMQMDVTDESGKVSKWTVEFDGRLNLTEHGWNEHTIVIGQRVTVTGNPTHVGAPRIFFVKLLRPDGTELRRGFNETLTEVERVRQERARQRSVPK